MNHFVAIAVLLASASSIAMSQSSKTTTIETPTGTVTATTQTVEPTPQRIIVASSKEVLAMDALALRAKGFLATYLPSVSNPSLTDFDNAFLVWQGERNRRYTEPQVVEMLGAYLGNQLIAEFQMEWVVVTDQNGTDYAVRAKKYEVMAFPFSSVAKRIERDQYEFMVGIYHVIKHSIASGDYKAR
jgi:ABC-type Fe3+-hydroxamate transport system substrate-binding protein